MGLAASESLGSGPSSVSRSQISSDPEVESEDTRLPSISDQFFVASFSFTNLILARLILGSGSLIEPLPDGVSLLWGVVAALLGTLTVLFCLPPLLSQAYRELSRARLSIEVGKAIVLMLLCFSTVWSLAIEPASLREGMVLDSLVFVSWLLVLEQWLFERFNSAVFERTRFDIAARAGVCRKLEPYPNHAPVEKDALPREIRIGELFRVVAGRIVPCDGVVAEGIVELAERKVAGSTTTKVKSRGHKVYAGSLVVRGEMLCEATAIADDSVITSCAEQVARTVQKEESSVLIPEAWETRVNLLLLVAALAVGAYFYGTGEGVSRSLSVAAAVIVLSLLLRISTVLSALGSLAVASTFWQGFTIKGSNVLKRLRDAKSLILDFVSPFVHEHLFVKEFSLIDQRIEQRGVVSVVLSMLGASEEQRFAAISKYIYSLAPDAELLKPSDIRTYDSRGISATVGGADFTIGSEGLLIERGVYLQASDVVAAGPDEQILYIAMGDELLAYFVLEVRAVEQPDLLLSDLRRRGMYVALCSAEVAEKADRPGKLLRLELAQIFGSLVPERYIEKLRHHQPTVLVLDAGTDPTLAKEADATIGLFDELRWDLDRADVMIFTGSLSLLSAIFETAARFALLRNLLFVVFFVALATTAVSSIMNVLSVGVFSALAFAAVALGYGLALRMMPETARGPSLSAEPV